MRSVSFAWGTWCVLSLWVAAGGARAQETLSTAALYQQSCAPCHGVNLEGGQAQSLVDAVWQFGSSKSHIFRNVKYGIADFNMPAFGEALSDRQINEVIDFIFDAERKSGVTKPPPPEKIFSLDYEIKVEVVAQGLDIPWAIAFAGPDLALITERPGTLRVLEKGRLHREPVRGTPEVLHEGQGGLLDVAVDPDYARNGWIYLAYSHALPDAPGVSRPPAMTRLVRGRLRDHQWIDQEVVYEAPHDLYLETRHHYGCRIVFDQAGHLFFSIGERGLAHQSQDLGRPNGKIHRIFPDGRVPDTNPFVGREGALASLFTFGNRNPQGLAVHPVSGDVWESEHGPMGGDELNRIRAGRNYGWPLVTYGRNYDGATVSAHQERPGMESPVLYWNPSIAACGIDFVQGKEFPRWRHQLLVGALKYEEVRLLDLRQGRVLHQEILLKNAGRVRDVGCAPDGSIYVVINGPDSVLRLTRLRDMNEN